MDSMSYKRDPRLAKIEATVKFVVLSGALLVVLYGIVTR
jgi:hypothetical protein